MKIRQGFVSNSSSSSFLVIDGHDYKPEQPNWGEFGYPLVVNYEFGHHKFGWEQTRYYRINDKIMFCWLQICYARNLSQYDAAALQTMLEEVIKENTKVTKIKWLVDPQSDEHYDLNLYAYIDHQSTCIEGKNMEMFESKEKLKNFLFNPRSFIQGDNDNH